MVGTEMEYNQKSSASRKVILLCCYENSMLKWLQHGFSEQLDLIDCVGKYFLMVKMAFLLIPNICFHGTEISWKEFFSAVSQGISLTNILITMMKDIHALF